MRSGAEPRPARPGRRGIRRTPALLALLPVLSLSPAAVPGSPVSLDDCIAIALDRSPDLGVARERLRAAEAEIAIAESAFAPTLRAGESYAATNNPPGAFLMALNQRRLSLAGDFNDPPVTDNFHTEIGLDFRLYDGGRRGRQVRAARSGSALREAEAEAVRNDLLYQVHRGYFGVLQAREFVRIQEAGVGSLERSLAAARHRLAAGTTVKTDVLNLEVRLAESLEALARSRNREALARSALANLVGHPDLRDARFPDSGVLPGPDPEGGAGLAPDRRPELRAAAAAVDRAAAELERARRARRPAVDLQSRYDLDTEEFEDVSDSWFASVAARWEIYDGPRRRAAVRKAEADLAAAREGARRVGLDVEHELRQARLALAEAQERVAVTAKSVELAEESLRVTRRRYESGAAEIAELLGAEAARTSAHALATAALYDREVARAGLRRAAGEFAGAAGMGAPRTVGDEDVGR